MSKELATDNAPMHFKISSGLKRVLGRDLITDEFVAIFELVKNSFDASALNTDIVFINNSIFIIDDGKGMTLSDIKDKWLFVAYSAKKDGTEDSDEYRNRISSRRSYAGSKGVGRFSCDRLGSKLTLQTRRTNDGPVEVVDVDWTLFEQSAQAEFDQVPVLHSRANNFSLPPSIGALSTGTVLEISDLREFWPREKLLKLRSALAKIINPFGDSTDGFTVKLWAPHELETDAESDLDLVKTDGSDLVPSYSEEATEIKPAHQKVNGPISNFIFDTLRGKTTSIDVRLSDDGHSILTSLTDRGELIYEIRQDNKYKLLTGSGFNCSLFYLNRSAKHTFAQRMGVNSVSFGSIFLFKNGFRIFPIGEKGTDTFGIDRRKAQGYNRFLGTRDLIGRIDIYGSDEIFRESTSRDQGLIDTPAYHELMECFDENCFRRLERYVVGVNWKDPHDLDREDTARLKGDSASARIAAIVSQLAGTDGVELVRYSKDLVRILNERSDDFSDSITSLRLLAEKSGDARLLDEITAANDRFVNLQRAEQAAREAADRERLARRDAERIALEARTQAEKLGFSLEEEKKRSLFLTSLTSLDQETVEILHHQIIIHAAAINEILGMQFDRLRDGITPSRDDLLSFLENISFQNRKVLSTARFATKANFRLDSEQIEVDLAAYIVDYLTTIAPIFADSGISIDARNSDASLMRRFKPIEVSILLDNLISNASRAQASDISFDIRQASSSEIEITVKDNGNGLDPRITDPSRIFEKGFTTSTGSGLGLYHISQILDDLGGSIAFDPSRSGAQFTIRIKGR
ncbi:sensor histidine kinase [Stenotrophomonas sp. 59]|uniref:ATP-binding protein n=1 Tax=Stenotrophomonas sp. 59 TaxID=3051120 RepID=UPI00256F0E40|nr:sensor histidine kinase [Stenotrophomonas sp. 59]